MVYLYKLLAKSSRRTLIWVARTVVVFICFPLGSAFAFPAPDIVINLFGSGAQLLGIFGASLGATWFGIKQKRNGAHATGMSFSFLVLCGLLIGSLLGNLWQYCQQTEQQSRRLQTNLLRTSPPTHPIQQRLSIGRDEFHQWMLQGRPYNLIDVREPEEFELGYLPGAKQSRFADLFDHNRSLLRSDIPNVLICDSGFRSGEICTVLASKGIPCRFIAGGYVKWTAEGRNMEGVAINGSPGFQSLPRYSGDKVLLDTLEVDQMVRKEAAQIIDTRTPAEFKQSHIPNAINLPIREETSERLAASLKALPHVPTIAACYDNRSCFYSKIAGLRLTRSGIDFRGRFTVPQEYPIPEKLSGSLLLRKIDTYLDHTLIYVREPARALLETVQNRTGDVALSIVFLAVLLRLFLVPVSFLVERSRSRLFQLNAKRGEFQRQYAHTSYGEKLVWRRLLKREGIRPGRDFLLGLLQLALQMSCLAAVSDFSWQYDVTSSFPDNLSEPELHSILSSMSAIALASYLALVIQIQRWWRWPLICVIALGLGYGTATLTLAVSLYLLASLILLLAQQRLMPRKWRFAGESAPEPTTEEFVKSTALVVDLADAIRHRAAGPKAVALARMLRANLPVPNGFFVVVDAWITMDGKSKTFIQRCVMKFARGLIRFRLKSALFAVRSATINEDNAGSSQAGQYLSLLNVAPCDLNDAIDAVCRSCSSARNLIDESGDMQGVVIVQLMVASEYSGVLFTQAPDNSGAMWIELASGAGGVVSGRDIPYTAKIGRGSGMMLHGSTSPIDLAPLWRLARRVEVLFGVPQDIEWAYRQGRYYLLQSRPITRRITDGQSVRALHEQERSRLIELACLSDIDKTADWLVTDDLVDAVPNVTPLSLSLIAALRNAGGATDLAWRRLEFDYAEENAPQWVSAFGCTRLIRSRAAGHLPQPGLLAQLRFARKADRLVCVFHNEFLPSFRQEMRLRQALDLNRLTTSELFLLLQTWVDEFVHVTYVEAETINLAANLFDQSARLLLNRRGLEPSHFLRPSLVSPNIRAIKTLMAVRDGQVELEEFMNQFGHRAAHDFELAEPRHTEESDWFTQWRASLPDSLNQIAPLPPVPSGRWLAAAVVRAQRFLALKEEAKHECVKGLAELRRLLLALDERLGLRGKIFYFTLSELAEIALQTEPNSPTQQAMRISSRASFVGIDVPNRLSMHNLEELDLTEESKTSAIAIEDLCGQRVAGSGRISGVACVLRDPAQIKAFRKGCILVIPTADPAWGAIFPLASGVVSETGGWLCHAAILARECALPAVFGVVGAMARIHDGDYLEFDESGHVSCAPHASTP